MVAIKIDGDDYDLECRGDSFAVTKRASGARYVVRTDPTTCTCKAFQFRHTQGPCKHGRAIRRFIMETTTKERVEEAEFTATVAPTDNLPAVVPPAPAVAAPGRGQIARALVEAQSKCEAAGKDKKNAHHGYKYASAEEIITVGKVALGNAGLALIPVGAHVNGHDREGENRFELEREFLLMHTSGETLPIKCHWPICPDKGRPLDKATAIADTLSLSYLLRDLLLMPRVDDSDDAAGRDDTGKPAKPAKAANGQKPAEPDTPAEPKIGPEDLERLQELIGSLPTDPERVPSLYRRFKICDLKNLPASQYQTAVRFLTGNLPITSDQNLRIRELIAELGIPPKTVREKLHDYYRAENVAQLKQVQAADMIEKLLTSKAIKAAPAVPAGT